MSRLFPPFGFFGNADMPPPENSQNARREEMKEINTRQNPEMLGLQGLDLAEGRQNPEFIERERRTAERAPRMPPRHHVRAHDTRDTDPRELLGRIRHLETLLDAEVNHRQQADVEFSKTVHIMDQEFRSKRESLVERANRQIDSLVEARNIRDEKIKELEGQVAELKRSISSAGHIRKQVADDELRDGVRRLGHEIQNLVVKRTRGLKIIRTKVDLSETAANMISEAIPDYWEMKDPPKNGVCQAIIARQLMRIFGVDGFFGLPQDTPLSSIAKLAQYFERATPSNFNEWRRLTMCLVDDVKDEAMVRALAEASHRIVASIDDCLGQLLGKTDDVERVRGISALVSNAVKLAHTFRMQQARFNFTLPTVGRDLRRLQMDPKDMEDIHGENSPELEGKPVLFAILPAVFKFSGDRDEEADKSHIICKLRVLVADEEQ